MDYTQQTSFSGNFTKALDVCTATLTTLGFRIVSQEQYSRCFEGPGMQSTKQNPILGASTIRLSWKEQKLVLDAELKGLERMRQFLLFFPPGLALFFVMLFGILFHTRGFGFVVLLSIAPLLPWLVLSPLLIKMTKTRTLQALDTLLNNIAAVGGR
jgi:hypothetical protein